MSPDLERIATLVARRDRCRNELREAVAASRTRGRSWALIGRVVGISRQAARERFGGAR